jgi:predicted RNA-binding protein YlqC (UPF0109 family)
MSSPFEYYFPPIFSFKEMTEEDNKRYELLIDCLSSPYVSYSYSIVSEDSDNSIVYEESDKSIVSDNSEIEIMITNKDIGKVIGKGGYIISKIRQESGATIKIFDKLFGMMRKIKICGKESNVNVAKEKIIQCIPSN